MKQKPENRAMNLENLREKVQVALLSGVEYFIVSISLSTTMFGSVDDIDAVTFETLGAPATMTWEQSLAAYQRGVVLVKYCRDTLGQVAQRVRILEADLLQPFDTGADDRDA